MRNKIGKAFQCQKPSRMEKNDSQWSPVRADGKAGGRTDLRLEMGEGAHRALILSYFTGASSA